MDDERFSAYFALDGRHLDGLMGSAGLLRFDWPERKIYIQHYEGISAAHNPSIAPNGQLLLLGNFGQEIVLIDISKPDLKIVARQATMYFEPIGYRLRANTHHLWYPDNVHFLGAVGDHLYRFHIDHLREPEQLGPHGLENAHELRWDSNRRYVLIGDLGPEKRDVRQLCVFDLEEPNSTRRARVLHVQNNVWHVCVDPQRPVGYAFTYSLTTDNDDWIEWSPYYAREYIYEIDLPTARIMRTWSCGAEFPIHLNSDVECSRDGHLYVASGGSHTVVDIPTRDFTAAMVHTHALPWWVRLPSWRQELGNLIGAASRRAVVTSTHYYIQTLQVTGCRLSDGVYASRVSPGGRYLVVGNRGYNVLSVYERNPWREVYRKLLPFRRERYDRRPYVRLGRYGHHLGIHHSEVTTRQ
jgi:hypothetical protein